MGIFRQLPQDQTRKLAYPEENIMIQAANLTAIAGGGGNLDKDAAEVILKSALSLGERINDLDRVVRDVKDVDERKRLLKCLGVVMAEVNAGIVLPIVSQYPEMDPDKPK